MNPYRRVRQFIAGCLLVCNMLAVAASETTSRWELPPIQVVDENDRPVAGAEVSMILVSWPMTGFYAKRTAHNGNVVFDEKDSYNRLVSSPEGTMRVMALVPGKAPAYARWDLPTSNALTVKAVPGTPVDIILEPEDDRPIPEELLPFVFPSEYAFCFSTKSGREFQSRWAEKVQDNGYRIHLGDTTHPLYLGITHPNYLIGFRESFETTAALQTGKVTMKLPKPAELEMKLDAEDSEKSGPRPGLELRVGRWIDINDRVASSPPFYDVHIKQNWTSQTITVSNIAPTHGLEDEISATISQLGNNEDTDSLKKNLYREGHRVQLASGETTTVQYTYRGFSPSLFEGNCTATFRFQRADGTPAAGIKVHIMASHPHFSNWYSLAKGPVDDTGTTVLTGLSPDATYIIYKGWGDTESIGGYISFKDGETSITQEFTLALSEGDVAPNVKFYDLETSEPVQLSSFKGQVVLLDFWASWCGPCQQPMTKNQSIMEKKARDWEGRATILAASVDADQQAALRHVLTKGWTSMRHAWCGERDNEQNASRIFGVKGIPSAFLINKEGVIVWAGHAASVNVEEEFERLLTEP